MKRSFFMFILTGMAITALVMATTAQTSLAQRSTPTPTAGRSTPTPTPVTGGGGGKPDKGPTAPPPLTGKVHGFVYDYSNAGAPQPGIAVILDGGGWQTEYVTNSDGYYEFAGLGEGSAVLNLRLPPGTHPVAPGWPVQTGDPGTELTHLGFYWGDTPPLPVVLSMEAAAADQRVEFTVTVDNRSGGVAGDATVTLQLPAALAASKADTSHGTVESFEQDVVALLGNLPTGETATLSVKAVFGQTAGEPVVAGAMLVYHEQLTGQRVTVELSPPEGGAEQAAAPPAEAAPQETPAPPAPTAGAEGAGESETLIPTTGGGNSPVAWPGIALSILFIVGLSVAGIRAFARRRV